jgi:serine/threonine-protein kinase
MVGLDGVSRVLDFGIAKAASRLQSTRQGQMKGKFAYMAPEQMGSGAVDRRADIFAAGIVFWEALTMKPLFHADDPASVVAKVASAPIARPSFINSMVSPALDRVVMKALDRNVDTRFQTARDFAMAIEEAISVSTQRKVGEWVAQMASKSLSQRADMVSRVESSSFDAQVCSDPLQVLRSKRETSTSAVDTKRTERASQEEAGHNDLSNVTQASSTGRGELLPTPPTGLSTYVPPFPHRTWPAIAGGSLLALVAVVGTIGLLHRRHVDTPGGVSPGPAGPMASSVRAPTVPQPLPHTPTPSPAVAAPKKPPTTAPATTPSAPVVSAPATLSSTIAPSKRMAESRPKTAAARLAKAGKRHGRLECDPPYTIDPNGIRRVKRECL